ncbi:MAG: hypothetical protein MZW92_49855 [Comamonadaceae bacterium]|nr:hypothetical protein [Comamonadaceae bacterium]
MTRPLRLRPGRGRRWRAASVSRSAASPTCFSVVLAKGVDLLVQRRRPRRRSSAAFRTGTARPRRAPTFILLPLTIRGAPVGADLRRQGQAPVTIVISEKELSLLRTLRNQAVLAIKQSS